VPPERAADQGSHRDVAGLRAEAPLDDTLAAAARAGGVTPDRAALDVRRKDTRWSSRRPAAG
jgi:hypothetical protein